MGKLIIIERDNVSGFDIHHISGSTTSSPPTTYTGTGEYEYIGKVTEQLSDFVTIGSNPVALVTSNSSLDPGETAPTGKHSGPAGKNFSPNTVDQSTVVIVDTVGKGKPGKSAGSSFVTVGSTPILLNGDKFDTCGNGLDLENSTVRASGQDFVRCSG